MSDNIEDFVKFGLEHWGADKQGVANTRRFLLEWLSFLCRYVPVGIIEGQQQTMNKRPPLLRVMIWVRLINYNSEIKKH